MATEKLPASEEATKEQPDLIEQATESMLGPNPFIGLRSEDIIASFRALGQ
jgi:polyhydroxyalkanoate synthase